MSGDNINCPIDLLDDDSHDDGVPTSSSGSNNNSEHVVSASDNIESSGFRDSHYIASTAVPDGYAQNMRMISQNNNHETTTRQSYYEATTQPHQQQTTSIHNTHMSYREGGDGSPAERKTSFGIRSEDYSTPVKSFVQMTPNNCTTEYKNQLTEEISYVNNNHNNRKLPAFERIQTDRFNAEHHPAGTVTDVGHNQDLPYYRQEENYNVNTYSKEYVVPTPTAIPRHNTSSYNDFDRHHTYYANEEYTSMRSPNYNNNSNKENNEMILKDEIDRLNQELLNLHREHKKDVIQFNNENKKLLEENYQLKNKINELQQLCAKEKTLCDVRNERNQQIILENLQLKRKLNQLNQDHSKKAQTTEQNHPHARDNQQEVVEVAHDNGIEVPKKKKSKTVNQTHQQVVLSDDKKASTTGDENTPTSFQFHSTSGKWQSRFQELVRFKEKNGNFNVPQGTSLYFFIQNQKTHYNYFKENKPSSMSHEKIAALESIGFEWSSRCVGGTWDFRFQELVKFKQDNGHMKVPFGTTLGNWINKQRYQYNNSQDNNVTAMKPEHITKLESIGFEWSVQCNKWDEKFQELVKFKEDNGHIKIPRGTSLSNWIQTQKTSYKNLQMDKPSNMTTERIFKLESVGIEWRK